ncbi:MAG: AsmA family protein [Candidatus Aureabacteria bacterium]|nr:AsmA family protein [Candidatus Auribacterota bacterium]
MRIRRALLIVFFALLLAAAVAYYLVFSPRALVARVRSVLERHLAAEITLGSASLHPLHGLRLNGITVRRPGAGVLFTADSLRVRPRLAALLRLRAQIAQITLRNAHLTFATDASGRSNWAGVLETQNLPAAGPPPVFRLTDGIVTIGAYTVRGIECDLTPFSSKNTIAVRGSIDDPFWGRYLVDGHVDTDTELLKLNLESKDLRVTRAWVRQFPGIGEDIWERYRPAGTFDLSGSVTYSWGTSSRNDYNLLFTTNEASLRYLIFPLTGASGRLFIDPHSIIINHLEGTLFRGSVDGNTLATMDEPSTYFNRYRFEGLDLASLASAFPAMGAAIEGIAEGSVTFQGEGARGTLEGEGVVTIPKARLWKFPVILQIISTFRYPLWSSEEPLQDCTMEFSLAPEGFIFHTISLVSSVMDIYGEGTVGFNGDLKLTCYARPVSKTPILFADLLLQQAIDSLSGNLAEFEVTGSVAAPHITVIPLSPVNRHIVNFFDALTNQRFGL